jgi:hypothetical protein
MSIPQLLAGGRKIFGPFKFPYFNDIWAFLIAIFHIWDSQIRESGAQPVARLGPTCINCTKKGDMVVQWLGQNLFENYNNFFENCINFYQYANAKVGLRLRTLGYRKNAAVGC